MISEFTLSYPPGFVLLCIAAGALYAWLAYQKKGPWSTTMNKVLFGVRTVVVSLLAILLLSPIVRQIRNYTEEPALVIAVDNSVSIEAVYDSLPLNSIKDEITDFSASLVDEGYDVELRVLDESEQDNWDFTATTTNLDRFLQNIRDDYEGRNLQEVILISDGIYNEGISPGYREYPFPISSLGIGDSAVKKDIYLSNVLYNKIAYQGNQFPLVATVGQNGFDGQSVRAVVQHRGRNVATKDITLPAKGVPVDIQFLINADEMGYQQYTISVQNLEDEFSVENNKRTAFVEIVEGKQQIHLVAAAPHPDLKAIKSVLENSENYEIKEFILSIPADRQKYLSNEDNPDLAILHQVPSNSVSGINWTEQLKNSSQFYIYGPATNLNSLNAIQPWITVRQMSGEFDRVLPIFNTQFAPFTYSDELLAQLQNFPPIIVPFGEISVSPEAESLLSQQIGSIRTQRPLLSVFENEDNKVAILLGSGIWQWKLTDYAENKSNVLFNELISKLVQYLSTRDNKDRFRLYPVEAEYQQGEEVVFETEVYNELYERVYGNRVNLEITAPTGEINTYSYVTSPTNSRYRISGLDEGIYQFKGRTIIDGTEEEVGGQVVVRGVDLEMINLTANFNMLRNLASQSGGGFYTVDQWESLADHFRNMEARGIIHSEESYLPAIDLFWLFLLVLILISLEWGLRKYHGSY